MRLNDLVPWNDRAGRFSPLHGLAFTVAVLPALWIAQAFLTGALGAEPLKTATHLTGTWTLYFVLASLAVTPLKSLLSWPRLIAIRRLLGVSAFGYIAAHFALYVLDQDGNLAKVASEIFSRVYLLIGFVALTGLAVLAATSFDAAMRRLRKNWKRLHRAIYVVTALGLLHFFMQSKTDVSQAVLLTGVFVALMLHRLRAVPATPLGILAVAVLAGLGAAGIEFAWYAAASGVPAERVLLSNLDFSYQIRPMWIVMALAALPLPLQLLRWLRKRLQAARSCDNLPANISLAAAEQRTNS
jgi:sulfoxide reductase heme-binding subunit YedZ